MSTESSQHDAMSDEERDLLRRLRSAADGSYRREPLPGATDEGWERLVTSFVAGDASHREALRQALDTALYQRLLHFAQRMASLAVRQQSVERLRFALLAIALAGDARGSDWRDTGIAMLPLTDAAGRLGPAGDDLFEDAARLASVRTATTIRLAKPRHGPWGRFVRATRAVFASADWQPTMTSDGFRYGR